MAVDISDSLNLTYSSPTVPTFVGGAFSSAAARKASGIPRRPDLVVYQQDDGSSWRLLPLALCFLSNSITPATNRGTWGTLDTHWQQVAILVPDPSQALKNAVVSGFAAMTTNATQLNPALTGALLAESVEKMEFTDDSYRYWYTFNRAGTLQWMRTYMSGTASSGGGGGTYDDNQVKQDIAANKAAIGTPAALATTAKSNTVAAINEVLANVNATSLVYLGDNLPTYKNISSYLGNASNVDTTSHDLIVVKGFSTGGLYLRGQNYRVSAYGAVFSQLYCGAAVGSRTIEVAGIRTTGEFPIFESDSDSGVGHRITLRNSRFGTLNVFQTATGGARDVHTFINCEIDTNLFRSYAYCGTIGHKVYLNGCTLGRLQTSGFVFGAQGPTDLQTTITNSTIYLNAGVALQQGLDGGGSNTHVFRNCTIINSDGSVTLLNS